MEDWRSELEEAKRRINLTRLELSDDDYKKSDVANYFVGKCVLLTGGAGFLGQLYIEKLLRIGVSAIYLILRPKKDMSPRDRIDKICSGAVYEGIRKSDPNFKDRIHVINGDLQQVRVGLNEVELKRIYENVNVVIHAAADIRFNVPLLDLVRSNVRGTKEILEISRHIEKLETFAFISTAYSHCPRDFIEEKFYEAPMDPEFWLRMLDHCTSAADKEIIEIIEQHIMTPWPNSYTYSKALSEQLVKEYSQFMPTVVIRPSIVVSTYQDPIPGWTNNLTGINGLCVGIGVGFLRHLHVDNDFIIDIICADYVVNTTLAAIWYSAKDYIATDRKEIAPAEIYHVTSKGFKLTSGKLVEDSMNILNNGQLHSMRCIYYPFIVFTHYAWQDTILVILLQAIPGFLMDFFNTDKRIRLMAITRKVQSMKNVMKFFMTKRLFFDDFNTRLKIYDRMSDADKKVFPADARKFEWDKFIYLYYAGLRVHALGDPLETWPESKKRLKMLKFIHYSFSYATVAVICLLLYIYVAKIWLHL